MSNLSLLDPIRRHLREIRRTLQHLRGAERAAQSGLQHLGELAEHLQRPLGASGTPSPEARERAQAEYEATLASIRAGYPGQEQGR